MPSLQSKNRKGGGVEVWQREGRKEKEKMMSFLLSMIGIWFRKSHSAICFFWMRPSGG